MMAIRTVASKFIFSQLQKNGSIGKEVKFDPSLVDFSDIDPAQSYYKGLYFEPSTATALATFGSKSSAADASHCEGKGRQSYGTVAATVVYDSNRSINPLAFEHFIGSEGGELWNRHFRNISMIHGFDVEGRVTFVDMEKGIGSGFNNSMKNAEVFYDQRHVIKNMDKGLSGSEKGSANHLYWKALKAPSRWRTSLIKDQYSANQSTYLSRFRDEILYRAFSKIDNVVITSQGAESEMHALEATKVRSLEPQKMLWKVAIEHQRRFNQNAKEAASCTSPVPPRVEAHIAKLITKAKLFTTVRPVPGTNMNKYEVYRGNGHVALVQFSTEKHTPPICCDYSKKGDGFPCYCGVAAIIHKHGSSNVYKFIHERHLTVAWKKTFTGLEFSLPDQSEVDAVVNEAKRLVASGHNLRPPKAIPPCRGRPGRDVGKRKKSFYEKGQGEKKRPHCCSFCGLPDHNRTHCPLRQTEDDDEAM